MPKYRSYRSRSWRFGKKARESAAAKVIGKMAKSYVRRRRRKKRMPLSGFPTSKVVKLKYCQTVNLDPAAGGLQYNIFRANSLFDPDFTGSGYQPTGFDNWAALYNHYTVLGCKMKVTAVNPTTADVVPTAWGIYADATTSPSWGTTADIIASKYGRRYRIAGAHGGLTTNQNSTMTYKLSCKKYFGVKSLAGMTQYESHVGGNPEEEVSLVLWSGAIGGTNPGNLYFIVEIEYIAKFTEPKLLQLS